MQTTAAEMTDTEADTEADTEDDTEADTEADTETKNKGKKKGRKNEKRKQTRDNDEEETLGGGDGVLEKSAKKCDSGSNKMKTKNKKKTKNKEKEEKKTKTKQSMDHLFSVDLVEQAKRHIIFLRTLHKQGITINSKKDLLEESFRRYSQLWLPFVAHHRHRNHHCASLDNTNNGKINQTPTATNIALIPPPDIAWFWHCHRLAPYRYAKYVQGVFFRTGHHDDDDDDDDVFKVLDPSHPFVVQLEKNNKDCNDTWRRLVSSSSLFSSSSKLSSTLTNPDNEDYAEISQCTRDLFAEMYPNESFFLVSSILLSLSSTTTTTPATGNLLGGFDLVESCKRQAEFLFQVSAPNFYDINGTFLQEGITNYSRFVKLTNHPQHLKHQLPHPLVPTYQIDLIWHTHILSSIGNYHEDVMKLTAACATTTGNSCSRRTIILNHDDSIDNDRSEGSVLDTSFQQTRKLWKDVYGLEYVVLGGMYRGEPPPEYYHIDWTPSSQLPSASNGMSIDHALAFIPAKTLFPCVRNRYMEGYVFGFGDKGYGYYNLNTHEANDVFIDRYRRMIDHYEEYYPILLFLFLSFIPISILFIVLSILLYTEDQENSWIIIGIVSLIYVGMLIIFCHMKTKITQISKERAWREAGCPVHPMWGVTPNDRDRTNYVGAAACGCGVDLFTLNEPDGTRKPIVIGGCIEGGGGGGGGCGGGGCGGGGCGGGGCGGGCGG